MRLILGDVKLCFTAGTLCLCDTGRMGRKTDILEQVVGDLDNEIGFVAVNIEDLEAELKIQREEWGRLHTCLTVAREDLSRS